MSNKLISIKSIKKFVERRFVMLIVFFTQEKTVCDLIAGRLTEKGHFAYVFTNMQKLLRSVGRQGPQKVDLLALDFRMGAQKDPGWTLLASDSKIPAVYYNDPYSRPGSFAAHWSRKIAGSGEFSGRNLMPLFRDLESVMLEEDVLPCVSLVCPPKKIACREERALGGFSIESFREKHSVQPSKFRLLSYFYQNRGAVLDAKRLCLFMWNEYSLQKKATLFSYICYLRKLFRRESRYCLRIISDGKNGYIFRISSPKFRIEREETASDYMRSDSKNSFDFSSTLLDD